MGKHRVLFLGTPDIATPCLEKLFELNDLEVAGVISQPDRPAGRNMKVQPSPVKAAAIARGAEVLTPESAKAPEVLEWIRARRPDSAVVVAYGQILSKDFLSLFPLQAVNVHASLLPRWRGAAPIQRAIMEGDSKTGVSLQVIVPKLDAGPLLGSREILIDERTNSYDLYMKLKTAAPELLAKEYLAYLRGELNPVAQDESRVTVAGKVAKEDGLIDWSQPARSINNRIRGLWMWPGSWTLRGGKTLKIWATIPVAVKTRESGTVLAVGSDRLTIACGDGALEVLEVQPESRAKMAVSEYLKGYPVKVGEKFGS